MTSLFPLAITVKPATSNDLKQPSLIISHESMNSLDGSADVSQAWLILAGITHAFVCSWQFGWGLAGGGWSCLT